MALNDLVFTDINDSPDNPRLGLGYHQLYDPTSFIGLISKLPDVTRVGDTITLFWDGDIAQQYDLNQPTIDKGWLSFNVSPSRILDPEGDVYYTLYDHEAEDLQKSPSRIIAVNRRVPGGLDPETDTAFNENMALCTVSPDPVSSPEATVTVSVPKWINQEVGDELTVMWNNIRVPYPKLQTLGPVDVIIPPEVLEQGMSSDKLLVNYEIRDIVDNYSLVSPSTYVTVEIDPDALPAPRVEEADRATLILDLEALGDNDAHVVIPSYIGNGNAYVVTLTWVGKTPMADISLNLPPLPIDDPVFDHATFIIPNVHLRQIAGGSAVARYSLVQQGVTEPKQSKTTSITLTGLPVELAGPVVLEAGGTAIIDLALVTGDSVTVSIAAYTGQNAGDKILLSWKGTPTAGGPVNYTDEYVIKVGEELLATTFVVLRQNLDPLGGGTLELTYQVVFKATGISQGSASTTYQVKAAIPATYPAPTVKDAPGGVLDPMKALAGATMTVAYDDMLPTDTIAPIWNGKNDTVDWQPGNTNKSVDFLVPPSVVAASLGKTFDVDYGVVRGMEVSSSDVLRLTVSPLPDSELGKSRPVVTEADQVTRVLDLNTFTGDAHVVVAKWPLSATGQRVWLTVSGPNGVPTLKLLEAYPITVEDVINGISRDISRAQLEQFSNGNELRVVVKVTFDGASSEASSIAFPAAVYTVKKFDDSVVPTITHVKDSQGIEIPENTITFDTNVTLSGSAQANKMVEIFDRTQSLGAATANNGGEWTRMFPNRASGLYVMKAKALYGAGLESSVRTFTIEFQAVPEPPAPDILEDNAANILDLTGLTQVTVRVPNYDMNIDDTVRVRWVGVNLHETAIKTIDAIAPLDFEIPLAWAREDIEKRVTVTYSYSRKGPIIVSLPLAISVVETGESLDLIRPEVVGAIGDDKDQLDFSMLSSGADVTVVVPQYTGMDVGQTVRVRWASRVVFQTTVEIVERIAPINFTIWRDEVIDSIGRLVDVNYSVVEQLDGPIIASRILSLNVLPQALDLVAPTINAGNTTVSVTYMGSLTSHTIAIRWRGMTDRVTGVQHPPSNGGVTRFTIPSQWVIENRGARVLINYSVGVGNNLLIYSQLLRIDIP
ncbi:hypothetical protein QN386_12775 [Pseudomonas sp. CCI3.2]|uniref:hypothetical protein n=1 Tax=unclassified Pseudomonas TaxID=196821 RepID=UPI002AC8D8D4|nr:MULTISPECIES: hypothetical protein [unclassified Pseudomonas]MEB0078136.1 hypothetical protein [Pseudomonas sp. MH10out]MEB0093414.1 hypothetical protein [Pseudomonas sp. CCI4.2]MEB0102190.1 hypothetical protein [Pseudomonas sp. CCI3.2]MEB0132327.1 hypothetical protein [Pseudomonas sp. CCI2.4]MEB0158971.1 hypothetical protein [Pseudomonas sp. AH2 (2023)]